MELDINLRVRVHELEKVLEEKVGSVFLFLRLGAHCKFRTLIARCSHTQKLSACTPGLQISEVCRRCL